MAFALRQPCVECPFDPRNNLYLRPARAEEIAEALERSTFACHMTLEQRPQQHCAGARVIMARTRRWGDMQQIAQRLGLFDPSKLNLEARVFDDFGDFVRFYGGTVRAWIQQRRGV